MGYVYLNQENILYHRVESFHLLFRDVITSLQANSYADFVIFWLRSKFYTVSNPNRRLWFVDGTQDKGNGIFGAKNICPVIDNHKIEKRRNADQIMKSGLVWEERGPYKERTGLLH